MNFNANYLMASMVVSVIGFGYFRYGKKRPSPAARIVGIVMMIFPYFITNVMWMSIVGVVLMATPWAVSRMKGY